MGWVNLGSSGWTYFSKMLVVTVCSKEGNFIIEDKTIGLENSFVFQTIDGIVKSYFSPLLIRLRQRKQKVN